MNFFQRRKILKKTNFLHITPVRAMESMVTEEGKVDVLLPRFTSRFWSDVYRQTKKGEFITIHLDANGSLIWQLIDGMTSVEAICSKVSDQNPDKFSSLEDAEKRVTQFLSLLYQQRYISFREIMNEEMSK